MNSKPVAATISFLFLAFAIYAGVALVTSQESVSTSGRAAAAPTLVMQTENATYPTITNFAATLYLDTANHPIDHLNAIIKYDPTILKAISLTPQKVFAQQNVTAQKIDEKTGEITYTVKPAPGASPTSARGSAAIVVFQALKSGNAQLQIDSASTASIAPDNQNILEATPPLSLTITD